MGESHLDVSMQNLNYLIWTMITLTCVGYLPSARAQPVYKSVDAHGNIVYSDQSSSNAQLISLPPLSTVLSPSAPPSTTIPSLASTAPGYTQLNLITPLNDQTIWDNNGNVNVAIALLPPLETGDTIQVILDGKVAASSNSHNYFSLTDLDRGTHVMQVQIINNREKIIKVSNVVTFYLHKTLVTAKKSSK